MDTLCTATKDLRHPYEMRKLQKGESTKFLSVYANHLPTLGEDSPHIHSPLWQKITKCQKVKSKLKQFFFYLHGEYLFSLNPQSNIRQLSCEWNKDRTNRKSRSFLSVTVTVVDGKCFSFSSVAAVYYTDRKQSRGEWVYSADNSSPLPTIVEKSNQECEASRRIASIVKSKEQMQALCSARLSYKGWGPDRRNGAAHSGLCSPTLIKATRTIHYRQTHRPTWSR